MADLTIKVDVRNDQTMSVYAVPKNDKLTFANKHATDALKVTVKGGGATPFCENDKVTEIPVIDVPAGGEETVRICNAFSGNEFLYTAQIGAAASEDPIVIIEPAIHITKPDDTPRAEKEVSFEMDGLGTVLIVVAAVLGGIWAGYRWGRSRRAGPET